MSRARDAAALINPLSVLDQTEINILDNATVTTEELNTLDGITATALELNILDGVTVTPAELNILDGATVTTSEINILDGVTKTAAQINLGVESSSIIEIVSLTQAAYDALPVKVSTTLYLVTP